MAEDPPAGPNPDGYDWTQFHVHMYYLAPLEPVFARFATAAGLASFYLREATFTAPDGATRAADEPYRAGDRYHFEYVHDYRHGGEILAVEPNRLVSFTFGPCEVAIRFRELDGATEVDLHQTGCPVDDPERAWLHLNCRSCWIYFLTNLRSVLAGGPDVRDLDHPEWNDSVSIGWDPATA
ncbi:MAG: SRPBCC domain-containing protein [Actinomycetota bacterium]